MKNTDFLNLELPEREDKINVGVLTSDFKIIEDIIKQHAVVETMELDGVGAITGAIGPYIRLQNISEQQVTVDIGDETIVLESGENKIIRETAQNIGVITSGNVHITYFTNAKTYTDRNFYDKEKVDELLKNVKTTVDAELSDVSENPVQNKAITAELASYATTAEVESKVTEKVAEIVAGAPEDFDTLKEMSDWLNEHEDSAATMNSAIQKNAADISTANTNITKNAADIATANTNIQKNVDDITAVKNDVAINKATLGTQCKNLLPYRCLPHSNSGGITVAVADDGVVTLSGTNTVSFTYNINFTTPMVFDRDVFIVGAETLKNVIYNCKVDIKVNGSNYPAIGTAGLRIPAGTTISYLYFQQQATNKEIEATVAPMIVYADVTDLSYEPYKPSLQEQLNSLIARIETLETTATEGGE